MENGSKIEKFNQIILLKIKNFLMPIFSQVIKFDLKKIDRAEKLKSRLLTVLTEKERNAISKLIPRYLTPFNTDTFLSRFGYYNQRGEAREFMVRIRNRKVLVVDLSRSSKLTNQVSIANPTFRGLTLFLNNFPINSLDENKYFQISCGAIRFQGRLSKSTISVLKELTFRN